MKTFNFKIIRLVGDSEILLETFFVAKNIREYGKSEYEQNMFRFFFEFPTL